MKKYITLCFLCLSVESFGQYMTALGSWYPTVSSTVITEAGNDYASTYSVESSLSQTQLSLSLGGNIFNTLFNNWRVDVSKSDINWHPNLKLELYRTGNGTGTILSSITNGTVYQRINNTPGYFFEGVGNYSNIPIKYRISGFSVLIPTDAYLTTVTYTLIDI